MSQTNGKNKSVLQIQLDGKIINVFNSVSQASKKLNIKRDLILRCCNGKQKMTRNYIFEYGIR
jgi:hypothetical protein